MRLTRWLAAAAFSAAAIAGPAARADLLDRLFKRSEARAAKEEKQAERAGRDAPRVTANFAVANEGEIGKFIHPVTYQALSAPPAAGPTLTPVPDPYPSGPLAAPGGSAPLPLPSQSFYPATPGEPVPLPNGPMPGYPAPGYAVEGYPMAGPVNPVGPGLDGFPLFERVKYEDLDHIHPCAVPTIVQVLDPCAPADPCVGCGPRCVYVKICVPPNQCPRIKVEHHGRKVKYKFDDYQVEVESKNGYVEVDYDD